MNKHRLVNEHEIGTCKMVDELEDAFLQSCKHHNAEPSDLKYFRQYVWNLFAMMSQALDTVKEFQDR